MARFLLDESADFPLIKQLIEQGHDVKTVVRDFQAAISDIEVLAIAVPENRIIITNDRDFGELVFRRGLAHRGIILFRLGDESMEVKFARLSQILLFSESELRSFTVVTENVIRIRHHSS